MQFETQGQVRAPAVAGYFYPAAVGALQRMLSDLFAEAELSSRTDPAAAGPKALIAPHAGYPYSGRTAAAAYRRLAPARAVIRRVVLLGPSHRVAFRGLALSAAARFATPLGEVPLDSDARTRIGEHPAVRMLEHAHTAEHSLEVHLPFLQTVLQEFVLVPLVVGEAAPDVVAEVLDVLWGGAETLVVVSSDLSHYLDYASACRTDRATTAAVEMLHTDIGPEQACGCRPLNGLLLAARRRGLQVTTLELCNSGDTAGSRDRVVGYGAYALA